MYQGATNMDVVDIVIDIFLIGHLQFRLFQEEVLLQVQALLHQHVVKQLILGVENKVVIVDLYQIIVKQLEIIN